MGIRIEQGSLSGISSQVSVREDGKKLRPLSTNGAFRTTEPVSAQSSQNELLKKFPAGILRKLEPHFKKVTLSSGEFLYRPDEKMDWLYFPETAVVSELQILEDGRTIEVSITGREGAIGMLSLFCPGRAANWVQVCGPGVARKINREVMRKETRDSEWLDLLFHEHIQNYIQQISQKVACNAHHSVEERFCTWLLMLQDRTSSSRLKLTQEHIARVLGVYRPSVTCIAQQLRDRQLIDYVRGNIVILDQEKLRERGCGCYAENNTATATGRIAEFAGGNKRFVF